MRHVWLFGLGSLVLLSSAGCRSVTCGPDTREEGGRCLPASLTRCGDGTRLENDACVPVSQLTCGANTVEVEGACVPGGELECGPGTEQLDFQCVVIDPMKRVTVTEGTEPNLPPGNVPRIELPAIGADPVVLGGIIATPIQGQPDMDGFLFTAEVGQRIRVEAKAVGAPSIGVGLQPVDGEALDFVRLGLTLDARGATREFVIPQTGEWLLIIAEQGALGGSFAVGGGDFSWTADVTQIADPAPRAITPGTPVTGDSTAIDRLSLEVTSEQPLFDVNLVMPETGFPGIRALWATGPDNELLLNASDFIDFGYLFPMDPVRLAPPLGTTTLHVDHKYVIGAPVPPYRLDVTAVPVTALGRLETPVDEQRGSLIGDGNDVYSVEVQAGELLIIDAVPWSNSQIVPLLEIRDAQFELVSSVRGTRLGLYGTALNEGRYYVVFKDRTFNASKVAMNYELSASLVPVDIVGPISTGATKTFDGTIGNGGSRWLALFAGNDAKLSATASAPEAAIRLAAWAPDLKQKALESAGGAAGETETLEGLVAKAAGYFLVEVTGPEGAPFSLTATAQEASLSFEAEPNDALAQANTLVLDAAGKGLAAGVLPATSDQDWFTFTIETRSLVTAETLAGPNGGKADTRLYLLSATGSTLTSNDDYNGTDLSRLDRELEPGTYALRVQRWTGSAPYDGDEYLLSVTAAALP